MRKTLFTCLALLLPVLPLLAQSSFVKPVIFGLKGGLNASFFTKDVDLFDPASSGNDPSFRRFLRAAAFAGITVDYMVGERFSVGAEVLYNARGMAYRQKNNSVIMIGQNGAEQAYNYFKYKVDYLELPLTAGYNVLPVASDNWLTGYVGLAPAIAINKAVKLDYPKPNAGPWEGQADKSGNLDGVRTFNTSMLAGIQFGGVPSFVGAYADLRASYTLFPVFTENNSLSGNNLNTRMLSFSFGIGLKF
ncbi:porin family protein [Pedobacter heparinus]|uniref:Outer membrane protein beta-barrel domain-containing protein n=1 Tax=Pedobacter heparinus (strain ATCC 13125 / DSM 2366 / CIP 104194 / JCM 7457 / NBRC 12017 / NCIMB 9290 / NRRL B-14731 / HIM 762-3) TaxID=485917 RepID=C6XTW0_PEDHD|nr:porin family protein [Pedobacter heparinus]ACU03746.1 hypothetical protein Phep_1533 [Pedobacter heparinus DSM 2366]